MLKKEGLHTDCLYYMATGNCLEKKYCQKNHPDVKVQTKKKLIFNSKKEFVPNQSIFTTVTPSTSTTKPQPAEPEARVCDCCKGFPASCRSTEICVKQGRCFCATQVLLEDLIAGNQVNTNTDCSCCKGDIYNCKDVMCQQLGMCQCQMHKEIEDKHPGDEQDEMDEAGEYFLPEYSDCQCCGGYVLSCGGPECYNGCFCLL